MCTTNSSIDISRKCFNPPDLPAQFCYTYMNFDYIAVSHLGHFVGKCHSLKQPMHVFINLKNLFQFIVKKYLYKNNLIHCTKG